MRIRTKAVIAFVGAGILCIGGAGVVLTELAREALQKEAFQHLIAVRQAKGKTLEGHFDQLRREMTVLAEAPLIGQGIQEFSAAIQALPADFGRPAVPGALAPAIAATFQPKGEPLGLPGEISPEGMTAPDEGGLILQTLYIAGVSDAKVRMERADAGDVSTYSRYHAHFHPFCLAIVRQLPFDDLFLVGLDGQVLYSVKKNLDLGANLRTGPLRATPLARAFIKAMGRGKASPPWIEPFSLYPPKGMKPASFVAAPVFRDGRPVGVLAAEVSIDAIDKIASGGRRWEEEGLGKTGEVYLVGPDRTLLNDTRAIVTDLAGHLADLRRHGTNAKTLLWIGRLKTGILLEQIDTDPVNRALAGEAGAVEGPYDLGRPVVVSYAPFYVSPTQRWAIIAEIDSAEAFAAVAVLEKRIFRQIGVVALGLGLLTWALSGFVVRPVRRLAKHARVLGRGDLSARVVVREKDELGQLAHEFNEMAERLQSSTVSRNYFSSVLESMMDPLLVTGWPSGEAAPAIQAVNRAAEKLLGLAREDLVGRSVDAVIPLGGGDGWLDRVRRRETVADVELDWRRPEGEPVPMLFSAAALADTLDRAQGIVCVGHDLRRHRQAEQIRQQHDLMKHELGIAHSVQRDLLPKAPLVIPGYALAGWSLAAEETGGDYFDWFRLPDGRALFSLADATGHSIGPALLVTVCHAYFRVASQLDAELAQVVARVNDLLEQDMTSGWFITAVVACLDAERHELRQYSAGHAPNFFYEAAARKVHNWSADALPLGILAPMIPRPSRVLKFQPGDMLLLLTDGFFEWENPDGELFGIPRISRFLEANHELPPEEFIHKLYGEVVAFGRGTAQADDLTAVVVRRLAPGHPNPVAAEPANAAV